jgi:hypothetical protein
VAVKHSAAQPVRLEFGTCHSEEEGNDLRPTAHPQRQLTHLGMRRMKVREQTTLRKNKNKNKITITTSTTNLKKKKRNEMKQASHPQSHSVSVCMAYPECTRA